MNPLIAIPALAAVAVGYGLGMVPAVYPLIHLNLGLILPVGPFVTGLICANVAIAIAKFLQLSTDTPNVKIAVVAACAIALLSTDVGRPAAPPEPAPSPSPAAADASHPAEPAKPAEATKPKDLGSELIVANTLGAAAGGFFALLFLATTGQVYCEKCKKYKVNGNSATIYFRDEDEVKNAHAMITANMKTGYEALIKCMTRMKQQQSDVDSGRYRTRVTELECPGCKECTLNGAVDKRTGEEWDELPAKQYTATSPAGLGKSFLVAPAEPPPPEAAA